MSHAQVIKPHTDKHSLQVKTSWKYRIYMQIKYNTLLLYLNLFNIRKKEKGDMPVISFILL